MEVHSGFLYEINTNGRPLEEILKDHPEYKLINNRLYRCDDTNKGDGAIRLMLSNGDGSFSYLFRLDPNNSSLDKELEESLRYAYADTEPHELTE